MTKKSINKTAMFADKFFVVGLEDGKPRGARFADSDDRIAKAAIDRGLGFIFPASTRTTELGKKLPRGKLFASGKAFIPNIRRDLYEAFAEIFANPDEGTTVHEFGARCESPHPEHAQRGPVSIACVSPSIAGLPRSWDEVSPGHMVLIHESAEDGWWEAVVTMRDEEVLTLKFRDYPRLPTVVRHISTVALVNPGPA